MPSPRATLPVDPIIQAITDAAVSQGYDLTHNNKPGLSYFCEAIFGRKSIVAELKADAFITPDRADMLACRLGTHPLRIWGDAWLVPFSEDDERDETDHLAAQRAYRQREWELKSHRKRRSRKRKEAA